MSWLDRTTVALPSDSGGNINCQKSGMTETDGKTQEKDLEKA